MLTGTRKVLSILITVPTILGSFPILILMCKAVVAKNAIFFLILLSTGVALWTVWGFAFVFLEMAEDVSAINTNLYYYISFYKTRGSDDPEEARIEHEDSVRKSSIEVHPNRFGEIECPKCHDLIEIRDNSRFCMCKKCGTMLKISK